MNSSPNTVSESPMTGPLVSASCRTKLLSVCLIMLLGLGLRLSGVFWGQGYSFYSQGDGIEAYSVAVNFDQGEARAQYLGQPNYNEHSKLPGPLWTWFCHAGLKAFGSMEGVMLELVLLNTLAIGLIYLLAARTVGWPASLWAALLAATLPSAVEYSVPVYNPNVMAFLGALTFLALWNTARTERSRQIFWVVFLLLLMPQFHMAGLALWPAVGLILLLSGRRINWPWLALGLVAGLCLYIPYVRGDMAHGWQNTLGMGSGKGGRTWDSLKALTVPLNLLISFNPRWTRNWEEYKALGQACYGSFALFMGFNVLSMLLAGLLTLGAGARIWKAFKGFRQAPRQTFDRAPGLIFLTILLVVPLLLAVLSGKSFHARYALALLPALLPLAGVAVGSWWTSSGKWGRPCRIGLVVCILFYVEFSPAFYLHQRTEIEQGRLLIPSFRKLESIYQQLKAHAGGARPIRIDNGAYFAAFPKNDVAHRDADRIHSYVVVRERAVASQAAGTPLTYRLCAASEVSSNAPAVAYWGGGIALVAAPEPKP